MSELDLTAREHPETSAVRSAVALSALAFSLMVGVIFITLTILGVLAIPLWVASAGFWIPGVVLLGMYVYDARQGLKLLREQGSEQ